MTARDGRTLAYLEVGDPRGPLVIHNHGGPSSRLEARLFASSAAKNRLRLICVDRPGIGQSSRQKSRTYAGWADDLTAIADALGHHEFGVTAGRRAARGRLRPRPPSIPVDCATSAASPAEATERSATTGRRTSSPRPTRWADTSRSVSSPASASCTRVLGLTAKRFRRSYAEQLRKTLNDYDRQILLQPDVEAAFCDASAECFAQGSDGLVRDSELLYRRWAFDVTTIERPVHMWQGTDDHLVAASINRTVADRMPGAVWHQVEGAGHFVAVGSGDDVFAIAAAELGA